MPSFGKNETPVVGAGFITSAFRILPTWMDPEGGRDGSREIEFVDSLPRTTSGKIRRVELRQMERQKKLGK
jgi:hypothetical protein